MSRSNSAWPDGVRSSSQWTHPIRASPVAVALVVILSGIVSAS